MNNKSINWYPLVIILLIALFAATFAALVLEKSKPRSASQAQVNSADSPAVSAQTYHWKMVTSWPKNTPGLGVGADVGSGVGAGVSFGVGSGVGSGPPEP